MNSLEFIQNIINHKVKTSRDNFIKLDEAYNNLVQQSNKMSESLAFIDSFLGTCDFTLSQHIAIVKSLEEIKQGVEVLVKQKSQAQKNPQNTPDQDQAPNLFNITPQKASETPPNS